MKDSTTATGLTALRLFLKTAGITQADLARELGVSRQWVNEVVLGRTRPSVAFREDAPILLAERLGVDAGQLREVLFPDDELSVRARRATALTERLERLGATP